MMAKSVKVAISIAIIVLIGWLVEFVMNGEAKYSSRVWVIPERRDMTDLVTSVGIVLPNRTTTVNAPFNGYVKKIFPKVGSRLQAGDPLVTISTSLSLDVEDFPVRAPFNGTVVQIFKSEGEYVETGSNSSQIIRFDNLDRLLAVSDFAERDIPKIFQGQKALIRPTALPDLTLQGRVVEISGAAMSESNEVGSLRKSVVAFRTKVEISEKDDRLKPGMSVFVEIATKTNKNVLTLPVVALRKKRDRWFVDMESGDEREVVIGIFENDRVEIISGLSDHERVFPPGSGVK